VVDPFNDWDEMEWQGLRSLLSLHFYDLPELVSLPVGLQHLTSLQTLNIGSCPKLTSLPEWIGGLTSLQTLDIRRCTILSERCKREIGEDWPKIAKIPNLYLYSARRDSGIYIYPKPNFFFLVHLSQYLLVIKFQIKRKLLLRIGT
jgi:hypothetical protein